MSAAYLCTDSATIVTTTAAELVAVALVDSGGAASLTVKDGELGDTVLVLRTSAANQTVTISFPVPVLLAKGLYIDPQGTTPQVSIFYV